MDLLDIRFRKGSEKARNAILRFAFTNIVFFTFYFLFIKTCSLA